MGRNLPPLLGIEAEDVGKDQCIMNDGVITTLLGNRGRLHDWVCGWVPHQALR